MTLHDIAKHHIASGMGTTCFSRPSRYVAYAFKDGVFCWFAPEDKVFNIRGISAIHAPDIIADDWFLCDTKGEKL